MHLKSSKTKELLFEQRLQNNITECDPLLPVDIDNTESETLLECLKTLSEKENVLKELVFGIDDLIQDKTEYEKELKSFEDYSDKISSLELKIKMRKKKCKIETETKIFG